MLGSNGTTEQNEPGSWGGAREERERETERGRKRKKRRKRKYREKRGTQRDGSVDKGTYHQAQ